MWRSAELAKIIRLWVSFAKIRSGVASPIFCKISFVNLVSKAAALVLRIQSVVKKRGFRADRFTRLFAVAVRAVENIMGMMRIALLGLT
jgi:hypothetical protein